jgi:superfamily II DNA helicase RecQ
VAIIGIGVSKSILFILPTIITSSGVTIIVTPLVSL